MSSAEAAEFAKLADTTYRDVNIALANEFAAYADRIGVDVTEVIDAANSQPYSHVHQPGLGVGGHCIPVYPHFLLSRAPELGLVARARAVNDGQVERALKVIRETVGELHDRPVLVLGLTYRAGVKELAYSRGVALVDALLAAGARVEAADPLLSDSEIQVLGATPWHPGSPSAAEVIVSQTTDTAWRDLDPAWFGGLRLLIDGRNSLRSLRLPEGAIYRGIGVAAAGNPEPAPVERA